MAESAVENGWTVTMERHDEGRFVVVRAAGSLSEDGRRAGELVAVWSDGTYDAARSCAYVRGSRLDKAATLKEMLATVTQAASPGAAVIRTSGL
ncbi:hypothetical protein ACWD4N_46610, partial [Streptomyces sp. NPDC002586]